MPTIITLSTTTSSDRAVPHLRDLRRGALAGVSALALAAGLLAVDMPRANAADEKTVVDGAAGGGYMVVEGAGSTYFGAKAQASGSVIENTIFTNFITQGGDGSGGGAGLGGVFFVDGGSNLTLRDVEFSTNTVVGGTGGSDPGFSAGNIAVALAGNQTSVIAVGGMITNPGLDLTGAEITTQTVTLSAANTLLKPGMRVSIPGITPEGETVLVEEVNGAEVTFSTEVTVPKITATGTPLSAPDNAPNGWTPPTNEVQLSTSDVGTSDNPKITVGSVVRLPGGGSTTVSSVNYSTGTVTFKDAPTSLNGTFDFVSVGIFKATPIGDVVTSNGKSTISMFEAPAGNFEVGMQVSGEGIPAGSKIEWISEDGKSIRIDKATTGTVTGFNAATIAATIGDTTVVLPKANESLKQGMQVSGPGITPGTTIQSVSTIDGKTTVVLSQAVTGQVPNNLSFSAISSATTGTNTITFVNGTMPTNVEVGMMITGPGIPPGTTVESVNGNTIELSTNLTDGSKVSDLRFLSPETTGGSMNGLTATGTGYSGMTGADNDIVYALINSGEGGSGKQGENGDDGLLAGQSGGAGGNGGNGGDALPFEPGLTLDVAIGAIQAVIGTSQVAADLVPKGAPIPVPDPAKAAVDAAALTETYTQLAKDAASLAAWNAGLAAGMFAEGGAGGDGGDGGNGSEFFGGGSGGNGGDGGDGGISASTGGSGGAGGAGGNGGFGAGGGGGGAGGEAGDGMYAPIGSPGVGGYAGFGGGVGSDGDGLFGGGGSGFGGAIFVRNGGVLTIEGNTTFSDNGAMGGSSTNGGKAGSGAGSDLFVMKGATVILAPGVGKTITFNGSIADDSRASYAEAGNAAGQGANITIAGPGRVVFNGANTYSGQTIIAGGTLDADVGTGIHAASNINFTGDGTDGDIGEANAGVLMTSGTFNRQIGTQQGRVQFTGSGGFAAQGGVLTVNIGGLSVPQTLTWGQNGFFSNTQASPDAISGALILGSVYADNEVRLKNNIALNNGDRQIIVVDNSTSQSDRAVIEGIISGNGALIVGDTDGYGTGTLVLKGKNTYTGGTELRSGTLETDGNNVIADTGTVSVGSSATLKINGEETVGDLENEGTINFAKGATTGAIDNDGTVTFAEDSTTGAIDNDGTITAEKALNAGNIDNNAGAEFTAKGKLTAGVIVNDASFGLEDDLEATSFTNNGSLDVAGGTLALTGAFSGGTGSTVDIDGDTTLKTTAFEGEGTVTLADGTTLSLEQAGTSDFDGQLTGDGSFSVAGGSVAADLTLTNVNDYAGKTSIASDATLRLATDLDSEGSIASSSEVEVDGTFDIASTDEGTSITSLSGSGDVTLGSKTLTLTDADTTFAGDIQGTGGITVSGGAQTLSDANSYTGTTIIDAAATLALTGIGSIEGSSGVLANGLFDIGDATAPVRIQALTGSGESAAVQLGGNSLSVTAASGSFDGVISGEAGTLDILAGTQGLGGANSYGGLTTVAADATLVLTGSGDISSSAGLDLDGTFDIAAADGDRTLKGLVGDDADASIILGANTLIVTGGETNATFAGTIGNGDTGAGGLTIQSGQQTLTGANTYTGRTEVADGATLLLEGEGSIATSTALELGEDARFDISMIDGSFAAIQTLEANSATVALGDKLLEITAGTETTSFTGSITGSGLGGVVVSGRQAFVDTSISGGVTAQNGGRIDLSGGSVTATAAEGHSNAALSVRNGGTINVEGTVMTAVGPDIYAFFDAADKEAYITIGTDAYFVANDDNRLLLVERQGGGANGKVYLTIDNGGLGTDKELTGDIIDDPSLIADAGGTFVTIAEGSAWSGKADAASFSVAAGASVFFAEGSKINGRLEMADGAEVNGSTLEGPLQVFGDGVFSDGTIHGNLFFDGDFSLGGFLTPGNSPGYVSATGNFDVQSTGTTISPGTDLATDVEGGRARLEMRFGEANHVAGLTYDQINIGGDMINGVLPVELVTIAPDDSEPGDRGLALGDLSQFGLIRIGGNVDGISGVEQVNRLTQNGHELRLTSDAVAAANRVGVTGSTTTVIGTPGITEEDFFDPGSETDGMIVYGLTSLVQDETYALAALTGLNHNAGVVTLGTFMDRANAQHKDGVWFASGGSFADIDDEIASTQTVGYARGGIDFVATDMFRLGVLGSYGSSSGTVTTELGDAGVNGSLWSGGVSATFSAAGFYVDATGQYGSSDWTISPVEASGTTTVTGTTAIASLESGYTIGTEAGSITPWGQMVYQMTEYGEVESGWVDTVDFNGTESLLVRGGVRVEAAFGDFVPYANVALAQDVYDDKTVTVDGFGWGTGMGGPRVELGGGFSSTLGENLALSTDLSGTQGIGDAGLSSYQGQVSLKGQW